MALLERLVRDASINQALAVVDEYSPAVRSRRLEAVAGRSQSQLRASGPRWAVAGLGVWFPPDESVTRAAAFVNLRGYEGRSLPLAQVVPNLDPLVRRHFDFPGPDILEIVAVQPVRQHGGPSGPIQATTAGTLGFRVMADGGAAILTAGHVVRNHLDRSVHEPRGSEIGTVIRRDCPSLNTPGSDCTDTGVIRLGQDYDASQGPAYSPPPVTIPKRADVTVYGRFATRRGWIEAVCQSWIGASEDYGDWAEVIRVRPRVSVHGESGAPVVLSSSGEALGHIVGGGNDYSIVQDLDYQLDKMNVQLA